MFSRRDFLKSTAATVYLQNIMTGNLLAKPIEQDNKRPNILLIVSDDQGYGDVSCYPQDPNRPDAVIRTPNIDSLAAQGVKFTQAYSICGICSPTRAGLLTGRYPQFFGYYDNWEAQVGVPKEEMLISDHLKKMGYKTACIGKWHIGRNDGYRPLERGFDRFYGILQGQHDYYKPNIGEPEYGGGLGSDEWPSNQDQIVKKMKYFTEELTDKAIEFIQSSQIAQQPFFLYLPYTAPHGPLQAPHKLINRYAKGHPPKLRDIARAMIDVMDQGIGKILNHLMLAGLNGNTLIIFTSDNGGQEEGGPERSPHHNGGLRPRKGYLWEGGIRIPMIICWPGRIEEGQIYTEPVIQLDLWPTIATAAGTTEYPKPLDGVDLMPFITGKNKAIPHQTLYWARDKETRRWAIRHNNWKLINEIPDYIAEREVPYRTVYELHDLDSDPKEQKNVLSEHPEIARQLHQMMYEFFAKCKPSIVSPEQSQIWHQKVAERKAKEKQSKTKP